MEKGATFKETETLELKRSTSELKEAIISISAMLNKHGRATVIFGIDDAGKVHGQTIGKNTLREISKSISDHLEPKAYPKIDEKEIDGKTCIQVEVQGPHVPYFAYNRAYMRTADEDRPLSHRELEGLFALKNKSLLSWDDKPCPNATLKDISAQKLNSYLKKAGLESAPAEQALRNLGIMLPSGEITNASILLFGKDTRRFIKNSQLRCAVFIGAATLLDMKNYEGDLFTLIDLAEKYVLNNIHISEAGFEGMRRIDKPEIDSEALREAIVNAFCHRDYHNPNAVYVAVYKDRVVIHSPGLLYGGLTIAKIRKGGFSQRRNELVADILHRVDLIERWGRGIPMILEKEPDTVFEEVGQQFSTEFRRKKVPEKVPETSGVKGLKSAEKVPEKVPKKYQEILEAILEEPGISKEVIAGQLHLPLSTVRSRLRKLTTEGLIKHVGPKKGGHWEVKKGA
ncbi:MAG: RNA-binding domain-containing protein [Candidatus Micrarchaeota archaeon]